MQTPVVCVLFVHGIGGYSNDDPRHLVDSFQKFLKLRQTAKEHGVGIAGGGTLTRQDFIDPQNDHELRIYALNWEPVTEGLKKEYLGYDQQPENMADRLPADNLVRKRFLDGGIPDVVLYVGFYKAAIQRSVKEALKAIHHDVETGRDQRKDYEYFFVTWSLGSKVVFDCLADPRLFTTATQPTAEPPGDERTFNRIAEKTHSVFMLANQLPLLTLGDVRPPREGARRPTTRPYESVASVAQRREQGVRIATTQPGAQTRPAAPPLSVVAVSDPNDLLSYPIPPWLNQLGGARFANVSISVARTAYYVPYIGWVSNPLTAHTGYGIDDRVVQLIIEGGKPSKGK